MKIKLHITLVFASLSLSAAAQQDPYYTHFKFVNEAYNSAFIGVDKGINFTSLYHAQWVGFDDQSPQPAAGGALAENVGPKTFLLNISSRIRDNKNKPTRLSAGISFWNDQLRYMQTTSVKGQMAWRVPLGENLLSYGVSVGMVQFGFKNAYFKGRQTLDSNVTSLDVNLDLGLGMYYVEKHVGDRIDNFYLGLSAEHLNEQKFTLNLGRIGAVSTYRLARHFYLTSGADLKFSNPDLILEPALLIKYNSKLQFDLNTTLLYKTTIRGGLGYRQFGTSDALSILLGYKLDQLQVGYSYDITLSRMRTVYNGTHEVFASYCLKQ